MLNREKFFDNDVDGLMNFHTIDLFIGLPGILPQKYGRLKVWLAKRALLMTRNLKTAIFLMLACFLF